MKGSVKVMLSYNFCHFEIALASDEELNLEEINEMRKKAQRLADEAVRQYIISKEHECKRADIDNERINLIKEVELIKKKPKAEWTAEMKAKVKALEDTEYWGQYDYNYDDDSDVF